MGKKLIEVALPLPEINDASAYDKMPGIGPHPKGIHQWWSRKLAPRWVGRPPVNPDDRKRVGGTDAWRGTHGLAADVRYYGRLINDRARAKIGHFYPKVRLPKEYGGREANVIAWIWARTVASPNPAPLPTARAVLFASVVDDPSEHPDKWPTEAAQNHERERLFDIIRRMMGKKLHEHPEVYAEARIEMLKYCDGKLPTVFDPFAGGGSIPLEANRLGFETHAGDLNPVAVLLNKCNLEPVRTDERDIFTTRLCNKKGSEAWLEPVVDKAKGTYQFEVQTGTPKNRAAIAAGTKAGKGGFRCLLTSDPIPFEYIRGEGQRGQLRCVMVAIVVELQRGRTYVRISPDQVEAATSAEPQDYPETDLPDEALGFRVQNYGIRKHSQMFTPRQLTSMVTVSDLASLFSTEIRRDAAAAGFVADEARGYAQTVTTFLALAIDRCADFNNALCTWNPSNQKVMHLFGQQIIRMGWEFAEANFLGESVGAWKTCSEYVADCIEVIPVGATHFGQARQIDAATGANGFANMLVSTDPPYYDNIGYGALSDFFYIWLRRTIGDLYPDVFNTVLVPKMPELTASPERFDNDKEKAKKWFEDGFRKAFTALRDKMDIRWPLTVYYAFKQDDEVSGTGDDAQSASGVDLTTGWETLLEALISSGFQVTATWPVRSEQKWRMRAMGANTLVSCIVLACRQRPIDAPQGDRRSFVAELKLELPSALRRLQQGNIAPVDFAQAAIGPGMAVYSRYGRILESTGRPMTVRTALSLINQTLTEVLSEQEDEFDADTRWALAWFDQRGFGTGDFGEAELLSKAKVTSVGGLQHAGLIISKGGEVRLLRPDELPNDWEPADDKRPTIWEMTHHLLRVYYYEKAGDFVTAELLRKIGANGEISRDLAYRLFNTCEKKKWSQEAQAYNALVLGWPEIARLARESGRAEPQQEALL
jgi:putative DNA methylase